MFTSEERQLILYGYLAGLRGEKLAAETSISVERLRHYLQTTDFAERLTRANKDMASSVVDRLKERLHAYANEMEKLALSDGDPRVRFQALKDLMDRGGIGPTQKMTLTSPSAYRKAIEEFIEDAPKKADSPSSDGDSAADSVPGARKP